MKTLRRKHKELITNSGIFDPDWYLKKYPDVGLSSLDPLKHFLQIGIYMYRMPNALFDPKWYMKVNPDVAKQGINPVHHYLEYGWREGRHPHPLFDVRYYLKQNPDVAKARVEPSYHYRMYGINEGRDIKPVQNIQSKSCGKNYFENKEPQINLLYKDRFQTAKYGTNEEPKNKVLSKVEKKLIKLFTSDKRIL